MPKLIELYSPPSAILNTARRMLLADLELYVRPDGNDANGGTTNSPLGSFKTIQRAINLVASLDLGLFNATIYVADGTYTNAVSLKTLIGAGKCIIQGNLSNPSNVLINTSSTCFDGDYYAGRYELRGMKLASSSGSAFFVRGPQSVLEFRDMDFGDCPNGVHVPIYDGAFCFPTGNYTISGDAFYHFNPQSTGIIDTTRGAAAFTITLSGARNFAAFCLAQRIGQIVIGSGYTTFSGSSSGIKYSALSNAVIDALGSGANYLPGSSAGVLSGGQYV